MKEFEIIKLDMDDSKYVWHVSLVKDGYYIGEGPFFITKEDAILYVKQFNLPFSVFCD